MGRLLARCFCVFSAVIWQEMTFVIVFDPGGIPKAAQYVLTCTYSLRGTLASGPGSSSLVTVNPYACAPSLLLMMQFVFLYSILKGRWGIQWVRADK